MVLDSAAQMIYLFGGWDGTKDLSDFWSYNISESKWKLISPNTAADVSKPKQPFFNIMCPSFKTQVDIFSPTGRSYPEVLSQDGHRH